ncbi:MAG TPA: MoaD/ThiS family protein [Ktedonobacteraceae bacterium]|nr:MoaD/ThiS family protein [Ktedonobacteraceae bacterium]
MNNEKAPVILRLPSTLSAYSEGKSQLSLQADTIEQLLEELADQYPRVWNYLCIEQGQLRDHVRMFVNNQLVTGLNGREIALKPGQEIIVLPTNGGN